MTLTPTSEQLAIITAATETNDNLLISALAGAAKSTTLELLAAEIPKVNTICLAFNKRIADELTKRMPPAYTVKTLNALGFAIWKDAIRTRTYVSFKKTISIFKEEIKDLPSAEQNDWWKVWPDIRNAIDKGKSAGYVPNNYPRNNTRIMCDDDFYSYLEVEPTEEEFALIKRIYTVGLDQSFSGTIDFADQLLMPTVFPAPYPRFTQILIDEAQDLSTLNMQMLQRLYRKRIIAVGDQRQAIYGFRGAHSSGMGEMQKLFSMEKMTLSCSFRCPEEIVEHVRWHAPHMTSWSGTETGLVTHKSIWSLKDLKPNDAIICRNNAPLLALALAMLKSGIYPNLWGNDIAAGLIFEMKKFGPDNMVQAQVLSVIDSWERTKLNKSRRKNQVKDRANCFRYLAQAGEDLGQILEYAKRVFNSDGKIDLLTGHKSKGHEFKRVWFLDAELIGDNEQENNLRYVIATRSLCELTYINTDGCVELTDTAASEDR